MTKAITYFVVLTFMAVCTFAMMTFLPSCTMAVTNVMTDGQASDVVDTTPTTDIKADATIPISAIPASPVASVASAAVSAATK